MDKPMEKIEEKPSTHNCGCEICSTYIHRLSGEYRDQQEYSDGLKDQLATQARIIEECEKALDKIYRIPCHNPETCQSCLAKEAIVSLKAHKEKYNG